MSAATPSLLLRAALDYAEALGWSVFPLKPRGKKPLTPRGFKDATTDAEMIHRWWTRWPDANIGVATGKLSGVAVVDVDAAGDKPGPASLAALVVAHGELPHTANSHTSGGGRHYLFAMPEGEFGTTAGKLGPGIDTRGCGGYIVAPPSIHPSGDVYRWEVDPLDEGLADLPAWLIPTKPAPPTPQPPTRSARPSADAVARAERYIDAMPESVSGQGGHNAAFTAATAIVHGFELTGADARRVFDRFNSRCRPAWSDREIEHKLAQAASTQHDRPHGWLLHATDGRDNLGPPSANGKQPHADLFTFYTAPEFDALDLRREYHIPGMLAAGPVPTVLAGSFKTLKTSIASDMLLSLATGSKFLNHYPVTKPINVAMMSGESGGFALQSLARRILHARGWTTAAVGERFRICPDVLSLTEAKHLTEVKRFVVEHDIEVFAIDPTYLAMRGLRNDDAGSIFSMAAVLEPLARLGEVTGCTPVIVHHNSRGATRANPGEPAELADIAWSGFAEWAGQWLLLSRREKYNPDSDGEHLLWLSAGGRDGHSALAGVNVLEGRQDEPSGRRWKVEVEQASRTRQAAAVAEQDRKEQQREARKRATIAADVEAIVAVMKRMPEGETKTVIRDRAGLSGGRFNKALAAMLADDLLIEVAVSKPNGQTYGGFKVHPNASQRTRTDSGSSRCPDGTPHHPDNTPIGGVSGEVVSAGDVPGEVQPNLTNLKPSGCEGDR